MYPRLSARRGAVIVMAMVVTIVLLIVGVALVSLANFGVAQTAEVANRRQAHGAANTAVQKAIDRVQWMGDRVQVGDDTFPIGTQLKEIDGSGNAVVTSVLDDGNATFTSPRTSPTGPWIDPVSLDDACYEYYFRNFDPAGTVEVVATGVSPPPPTGSRCTPDGSTPAQGEFRVVATIQFSPTTGSYALVGAGIYIGS